KNQGQPEECFMRGMMGWLAAVLLGGVVAGAVPAGELEQVISREDPAFNPAAARLTVGRDGMIYLCSPGNNSFVLRLGRDWHDKVGSAVVYAATNATGNADGVVATANGHFAHKGALYNRPMELAGAVEDFLVSEPGGVGA